MRFTLEAVYAGKGDALILHSGDQQKPRWSLIDGGTGVWSKFLRPRLDEIREDLDLDVLPLDMVMVSHIDDDHINGVLSLMRGVARDANPKYRVGTLWHNAFDRLLGTTSEEIVGDIDPDADPDSLEGAAASVKQGVDLTALAQEAVGKGRLTINGFFRGSADFPALIIADPDNVQPIRLGDVTLTVLAPNVRRLKDFQKEWDKELKKRKLVLDGQEVEGGASSLRPFDPNDAFTLDDESKYNLASIVVMAEKGGKKMLLTGDATAEDIVEGLIMAGHLPAEASLDQAGLEADRANPDRDVPSFHVDLLKMPHHGSPNNVTLGFFRRVTADHYVISGSGEHGNPSPFTLGLIEQARGDADYTIHLTMSEEEIADHAKASTKNDQQVGLKRLHEWLTSHRAAGKKDPVFRQHDAKSMFITP